MCVKLPPGDLNSGPCPPHFTNTYTCRVTIAPKVCGGELLNHLNKDCDVLNWSCDFLKKKIGHMKKYI